MTTPPGKPALDAANVRATVPASVVARRIDDEVILLNLDNECYFGLDPVGTSMWDAVTAEETVEAACQRLVGEYDVEPDTLRADLEELLDRLVASGLIHLAPA